MEVKNLEISKNIRFYRKSLGLTQEELANRLGGKKSLVSNYENGYSVPDIFTLIKLADIFDVTLDELVGRFYK
jgi:transcriptional regulator with XRE-family HTH domain